MKHNLYAALFAGTLCVVSVSRGDAVAFWDFENSTETGTTPTNSQPFFSGSTGGTHGTADAVSNVVMHGWSASAGMSFVEGFSPFGGFCARSVYQDGYVWNDGNSFVSWTAPNWTLEAHVYIDETSPDWETFVAKMGSSFSVAESDFYFQRKGVDSNELRLNYRNADGTQIIVDGTQTLSPGKWYGLAAVADSDAGTITLYVDDGSGWVQDGQTTGLTGNLGVYSSTFDWSFMRDYYNSGKDPTVGYIENVRFSDTALSMSELLTAPFALNLSPISQTSDNNATIKATMINKDSDYVSSTLYLDDIQVATGSTVSGTGTNTISFSASNLSLTNHTAKVVVVGANPAVTVTNMWTFEVTQPPFDSVTVVSPAEGSWTLDDYVDFEVVVVENFETVDSASVSLDGGSTTHALASSSSGTTNTLTYSATGLSHGVYTGQVVIVGSGTEVVTNEVIFQVVQEQVAATSLIHHWDFETDAGGTTVIDLAGTADGTIVGTNYNWVSGGLDLFGGGASGDWNTGTNATGGSYVDLPNGLATALPNIVTFEVVYKSDEPTAWWQRLWDFGASDGGEDSSASGTVYTFGTTYAGVGPRTDITPAAGSTLFQLNSTASSIADEMNHLVWVYDANSGMSKMYHNGVLVDAAAMTGVPFSEFNGVDVNNWLGRSQWTGDGMFNGQLYDFRIYSGIMTESQVATRWGEVTVSGPTESPVITSIAVSGSDVTISWTDEGVGTYTIQRKTDLKATSWADVVGGLSAGTGSTTVTNAGSDQEFYQVIGE